MGRNLRCVEGRLFRHDPQHDDPYLETDVGECPDCEGDGCGDDHDDDGDGEEAGEDFFDCHMGPDGQCGAAGSEECDFECPTMYAWRRGELA